MALALLVLALGFLGGVASGVLGVGGGIVMAPALLYVPRLLGAGAFGMKEVTGLTITQGLLACLSGSLGHGRHGCVSRRLVTAMGPGIFAGALGADSGDRGIRGAKVWHGDALDVDAHGAELTRVRLLRREGYLDAPDGSTKDGDGESTRNKALPVIVVTTDVAEVVDQAEGALVASCSDFLYERGGILVRVVRDPGRRMRGLRRPPRAPRAEAIADASLFELVAKHATWLNKKGPVDRSGERRGRGGERPAGRAKEAPRRGDRTAGPHVLHEDEGGPPARLGGDPRFPR